MPIAPLAPDVSAVAGDAEAALSWRAADDGDSAILHYASDAPCGGDGGLRDIGRDGNGGDYEAANGTLGFAAGEREKTVSVTVLDDAHDEGEETLTLTLSNASGTRIADGTATGTIENSDPMPKAWMVRFRRTVGSHVVDALNAKLDGAGDSHVTVAGINLVGAKGEEPTLTDDDPFALPEWAKNAGREGDTAWVR